MKHLISVAAALWMLLSTSALLADQPQQQSAPAVKAAFLVWPYLQLPSENGITVMWETDQKLPSQVDYGTTPALGQTASSEKASASALHEVALKGLSPSTIYHYRVRSGDLESDTYTFKTAPPPGTKRWRLALYGDSRSNPPVHRKIAEQIAKAKVDLIVHTGDIVENGTKHDLWRKEFFEPLGPLARSVPWISTIGNHERDSKNYFSYMALPGNEHYFGFDYANAHIVGLDSNGYIEKGRDSKQYRWLTEDLARRRKATWTFVAFHHPLFSAHANRGINELRWDWAPIFLNPANQVDAVFTGHDHFYARNYRMGLAGQTAQRGVLFVTTAGGGAFLYPSKKWDYVALEKRVHHFTLLDFDGDRIDLSAIDMNGTVIDRYALTKDATLPEEYCSYEMEELKQRFRQALVAARPVPLGEDKINEINTVLKVPNPFRIALKGQLRWQEVPGWKMHTPVADFGLEPGHSLEIPLRATVSAGSFATTPQLTVGFAAGHFRNRKLVFHPFKLGGAEHVTAKQTQKPEKNGEPSPSSWAASSTHGLLAVTPQGGRKDQIQLLADEEWLYVHARLEDPNGKIDVKPAEPGRTIEGPQVLPDEHFRIELWDGGELRTFAVSPDQVRYATRGAVREQAEWRGTAKQSAGGWSVQMAIPRKLLAESNELRIDAVHRSGKDGRSSDFHLCPVYSMGMHPDTIPDWKPAQAPARWARLRLE